MRTPYAAWRGRDGDDSALRSRGNPGDRRRHRVFAGTRTTLVDSDDSTCDSQVARARLLGVITVDMETHGAGARS